MNILVTGAGGFVGRHVCRALRRAGDRVVACARRDVQVEADVVEVFDLRDASACRAVVETHRPDAVLHLAAQASMVDSWARPGDTVLTNVVGATNLLEAIAGGAPDARVVLVGSGQQYGAVNHGQALREDDHMEPQTPYAASKLLQEEVGMLYLRAKGMDVVFARPFNHTGPGQSRSYAVGAFCWQIAEIEVGAAEPVLEVGDLGAERDFLDVRDVARAYIRLLAVGVRGTAYNVASGRTILMREVLDKVIAGSHPVAQIRIESSGPRPGDVPTLLGDPSRLVALGWSPAVPIETSIADMLEHCRDRIRAGATR